MYFFIGLMVLAFPVVFVLQSQVSSFPEVYGLFSPAMGFNIVWLNIIISLSVVCWSEIGYKYYTQARDQERFKLEGEV